MTGAQTKLKSWELLPEYQNLYRRYSVPGESVPAPGDLVRTNFGSGRMKAWEIISSLKSAAVSDCGWSGLNGPGLWTFVVRNPDLNTGETFHLHGFEQMEDGRLVGKPHAMHTEEFLANGGGRNGDGRNEILIEKRADQGALF